MRRSTILLSELKATFENEMLEVPHLSEWIEDEARGFPSPLIF